MPERDIEWAHAQWRIMIWEDANLFCHAGVLLRDGEVNGHAARIGGIGGVMTHPDARHRGHAKAAMSHAAAMLKSELSAAFVLLVCRAEVRPLYAQLGWRVFPGKLLCEQRGDTVAYTLGAPMLLALHESGPSDGTINLLGQPW